MKVPSFRIMGGKARLRKWLVERFPKSGRTYLEPFTGRGNVLFYARTQLSYKRWVASDLDTKFLWALLTVDLDKLPETVNKDEYEKFKAYPTTSMSLVLEPRITFAGLGYKTGYSGDSGTHIGYRKHNYIKMCASARKLLDGVHIFTGSWDKIQWDRFNNRDFVYLDPPYLGTNAPYPNIDHQALVRTLNKATCRWAISGYGSRLYDDGLQWVERHEKVRNREIRSSMVGAYDPVMEVLWTNYEVEEFDTEEEG